MVRSHFFMKHRFNPDGDRPFFVLSSRERAQAIYWRGNDCEQQCRWSRIERIRVCHFINSASFLKRLAADVIRCPSLAEIFGPSHETHDLRHTRGPSYSYYKLSSELACGAHFLGCSGSERLLEVETKLQKLPTATTWARERTRRKGNSMLSSKAWNVSHFGFLNLSSVY